MYLGVTYPPRILLAHSGAITAGIPIVDTQVRGMETQC